MAPDGISKPKFEVWKQALRNDCDREGKRLAFDAIGDHVLQILWERGIDPSVVAIIESAAAIQPKSDASAA